MKRFWKIDPMNKVVCSDYSDNEECRAAVEIGNCFESREEALRELERRRIDAILRKHASKRPLLGNERKYYHICCVHDRLPFSPSVLSVSSTKVIDFATPLFEIKQDAYDAIEEAGGAEHIIKYYFSGV